MRKTSLMAAVLLMTLFVRRADAQPAESRPIGLRTVGGFVGLDVRFGSLLGKSAAFVGAEFGVMLEDRVYLGLRGNGLATNRSRLPGSTAVPADIAEMGYGGFVVGYSVPLGPGVGLSLDTMLGAGSIGGRNQTGNHETMFIFEPSATFDVRLGRVARIGVGAGYRLAGDAPDAGLSSRGLSGFTALVRGRAGWFPPRR